MTGVEAADVDVDVDADVDADADADADAEEKEATQPSLGVLLGTKLLTRCIGWRRDDLVLGS